MVMSVHPTMLMIWILFTHQGHITCFMKGEYFVNQSFLLVLNIILNTNVDWLSHLSWAGGWVMHQAFHQAWVHPPHLKVNPFQSQLYCLLTGNDLDSFIRFPCLHVHGWVRCGTPSNEAKAHVECTGCERNDNFKGPTLDTRRSTLLWPFIACLI